MKNNNNMIIVIALVFSCGLAPLSSLARNSNAIPLPSAATAIGKHHSHAETARLKPVSVDESRQKALTSTERIAGYPVVGELKNLSPEKSAQLAKLLLDKNNYRNILKRCANQYFHGIRFSKGEQKVEIAIGVACQQTVMVIQDDKGIKWWGSVLRDAAYKKALSILSTIQL